MKILHSQVVFLGNDNVTSVKVCCRGQLIELSANDPVFKGSNPAAAQVRELIKTTYGQVLFLVNAKVSYVKSSNSCALGRAID
jgi:hypothetical protein